MNIKHEVRLEGQGTGPTMGQLRRCLAEQKIPDDAGSRLFFSDSQREGMYWSITITWYTEDSGSDE